jgi:hypothetical protein
MAMTPAVIPAHSTEDTYCCAFRPAIKKQENFKNKIKSKVSIKDLLFRWKKHIRIKYLAEE